MDQYGIPEGPIAAPPANSPELEATLRPQPRPEPDPPMRPQRRAHATADIGRRLMGDLMQDYGLSQAQAAGIVGSLAHESGNFSQLQEIAPVVPGSRGGWGFAQWTGPRRKQMEAWAGDRGLDLSSYDANYGFLRHEFDNTHEGSILDKVRSAQTASEATDIFTGSAAEKRGFLRPGTVGLQSRLRYAEGYAGAEPGSFGDGSLDAPSQQGPAGGPAEQQAVEKSPHQIRMEALGTMFDGFFGAGADEDDVMDFLEEKFDIPVEQIEMIDPELGESLLAGIPEA